MANTTVKAEFPVPADVLWALVRDFGNVAWIPGVGDVALEGEGVGMVRVLAGGAVREQLESRDEAGRRIGYTILAGMPAPVTGYHATMTVSARGAQSCELDWSCRYEPDGVAEAEAAAQVEGLYQLMIGWIRDHLGR